MAAVVRSRSGGHFENICGELCQSETCTCYGRSQDALLGSSYGFSNLISFKLSNTTVHWLSGSNIGVVLRQ